MQSFGFMYSLASSCHSQNSPTGVVSLQARGIRNGFSFLYSCSIQRLLEARIHVKLKLNKYMENMILIFYLALF